MKVRMKTLYVAMTLLVLIPLTAMGGWETQNSGGTTGLYGICALNEQTAVSVGSSGTILLTENGGELWLPMPSGITSFLMATYFLDESYGWACGASGVILASTDGGHTWNPQSSGITQYIYYVFFIDSANGWACGQEGFILHTTNGGELWEIQTSGITDNLWSIRFANENVGWTVGQNGAILNTTDGGVTWTPQVSGTTNYLQSVFCLDENTAWVVGGYGTILKTTDGGTTWNPCVSGTDAWLHQVYFSDADHGWATGRYGVIIASTDGGENWYEQYTGSASVVMRSVSMVNNLVGWACGTSGTIVHTTNGGIESPLELSLTPLNPPIQIPSTGGSFDFEVMIANLSDSTVIYDAWTDALLPSGAPYPLFTREDLSLAVDDTLERELTQTVPQRAPSGSYAYRAYVGEYPDVIWAESTFDFEKLAVDFGGEVYLTWNLDGWDQGESFESGQVPEHFGIVAAYPNPFNPQTRISYTLPEVSKVQLKIYDLQGRLIATLIDRIQEAGEHSAEFNAANLSSGVYLCVLDAGTFKSSSKLLLLK